MMTEKTKKSCAGQIESSRSPQAANQSQKTMAARRIDKFEAVGTGWIIFGLLPA